MARKYEKKKSRRDASRRRRSSCGIGNVCASNGKILHFLLLRCASAKSIRFRWGAGEKEMQSPYKAIGM